MSASERICETCVYCTFAGNCDRYDKPLTSIEQPACNSYEIHPLLAENARLRTRLNDLSDENQKLRKLTELSLELARMAGTCDDCPALDICAGSTRDCWMEHRVETLTRETGMMAESED